MGLAAPAGRGRPGRQRLHAGCATSSRRVGWGVRGHVAQWRPQTRGLFGCGGIELRPFPTHTCFRRPAFQGSASPPTPAWFRSRRASWSRRPTGSRGRRTPAADSVSRCAAKRSASSGGGGASMRRPRRASSRPGPVVGASSRSQFAGMHAQLRRDSRHQPGSYESFLCAGLRMVVCRLRARLHGFLRYRTSLVSNGNF